ncbi:MAG: DedA family protein [Deltaproteobacteria bacterium]|nr:DedA family protein [Deltaproteobacteria bacterium]
MLEFLQSFIAQFAYAGIVAVLLAAGLGLPVPEDIPLMVGGLLSAQGVTNAYMVFGFAYVSILVGDFLIFSMGRRLGPKALQKPWAARVLTPQRQAALNEHFRKHGPLTIVVARHMAGLRAPCFLMAGVARMSPVKFILADGFGACLSVPLFIWVGYKFGENLEFILDRIKEYQQLALGVAVLGVVLAVVYRRFARRRQNSAPDAGFAALSPPGEAAVHAAPEPETRAPAPINVR